MNKGGRPSNWNNTPTKLERFPVKLLPQILEYARFLDGLPEPDSFVQNSDPIKHQLFTLQPPGDIPPEISKTLSFPQSLWEEADRMVDEALASDLKGLSERELEQFIVLLAKQTFKGES